MGHDSQSNEDEVILVDEVLEDNVVPIRTECEQALERIATSDPDLYVVLAQMNANIQEVVDFKREMETATSSLMSELENGGGMLGMALRMFKS